MKNHQRTHNREVTIRDLYPHLNEEQLGEAEENWRKYLELMVRIYERLESDPRIHEGCQVLTDFKAAPKMNSKGRTLPD